jgi:hypothetical protein
LYQPSDYKYRAAVLSVDRAPKQAISENPQAGVENDLYTYMAQNKMMIACGMAGTAF